MTEFGRQPWIVYGLMKTSDGVSPVPPHLVLFSLGGFILVYSILGLAGFSLIAKYAKQGPDPDGEDNADDASTGDGNVQPALS